MLLLSIPRRCWAHVWTQAQVPYGLAPGTFETPYPNCKHRTLASTQTLTTSVVSSNEEWPVTSPWFWASATFLNRAPQTPHFNDLAIVFDLGQRLANRSSQMKTNLRSGVCVGLKLRRGLKPSYYFAAASEYEIMRSGLQWHDVHAPGRRTCTATGAAQPATHRRR